MGSKNIIAPSRAGWMLLIIVFLFSGIVGHDPWKQDETYSFGIIDHFYITHSWLVPTNAGEPFMEKPPLYYWSAVAVCKIFNGILPLYDAARLTSFFYMLASVFFMWKLGRLFYREHPQAEQMTWITIALLLGTMGLVRHSHDMFTDVALLTGSIIALYGMLLIVMDENWCRAGFWLGIGMGIAFLSKGLLVPVVLSLSGFMIWILLPKLHRIATVKSALLAVLFASPFVLIWPLLLHDYSPNLFMQWLWENNIGRFFGFSVAHLGAGNESNYFLSAVLWFAFPIFPLACIELVAGHVHWRRPQYLVPVMVCFIGMALLLTSASARALYLLPLLPCFALLAAQALERISPRLLRLWNAAAKIFFSVVAILIWGAWWNLLYPVDKRPLTAFSDILSHWLPVNFVAPGYHWAAYGLAVLMLGIWFFAMRLPSKSILSTACIWLAGVALIWCTGLSLLMPWINQTKSFEPVFLSMARFLRHSNNTPSCIGNYRLGESVGPLWYYFAENQYSSPMQNFQQTSCPLLLTLAAKHSPETVDPHWKLVWKGARVLDEKDELRLYSRQ